MSWTILIGLAVVLGFLSALAFLRRADLGSMRRNLENRDSLLQQGSREAQLQHPVVDLSRCMGCSTCVAVCPETGVLEIVHGQAMVVNGAGCMGIAACERECPVGAIEVTLSNLDTRKDIPVLDDCLEAVGTPGLFLAGEVTAHALIKVAVEHGAQVAAEVVRRKLDDPVATDDNSLLDLLIVGAGPAGLACALEAKRQGLHFQTIDQASGWGGTVRTYPREKLVLVEPVDLPLHGRMKNTSYSKEELMELWLEVATRHELPLLGNHRLERVERDGSGNFLVHAGGQILRARNVCMAIGRRGSPRQLGVPGEDLPKVAHSMIDAASFQNRRILVVGGGDSATETALALATQPGNQVTLSYRKHAFFRLKSRNQEKLERALKAGDVELLLGCKVKSIRPDAVDLAIEDTDGSVREASVPNDFVFAMIGGVAPLPLLEDAGVSFDPSQRPAPRVIEERGSGLAQALWTAFFCTLVAIGFALWHWDYYSLATELRPAHSKHAMLRPGEGWGLSFGVGCAGLILVNLAYLLRRSSKIRVNFGSLKSWMTVHVATGILAVLFALLHAAMSPRDTVGGHSLWMLAALLVTGAIGRYFYAYVPRAANGRELALEEIRVRARELPNTWMGAQQSFSESAREEILRLMDTSQWESSLWSRMWSLLGDQRALRRSLQTLKLKGLQQNVSITQIEETLQLIKDAHRESLAAAHYEDLRAVASAWRYLHRWGAILMVTLVTLHIAHALIYGDYFGGGPR